MTVTEAGRTDSMQATPADTYLYLQGALPSLTVDMCGYMRDEYTVSHLDLSIAYPNQAIA